MTAEQFNKTISPIRQKLYRYALSRVYDPELARDIVQEVLVKLWAQQDRLHSISNLEAWLITCIRNLSVDKLKSSHRQTKEIGAALHLKASSFPDKAAEDADLIQKVQLILEDLPEKQREIFRLRELMGYSNAEIQEILSMDENQVKVNLFRARQKVKLVLKKIISYGLES